MELEESWVLPRTEIKGIYELPYGCWEPNPGPLQEQPVVLITESSFQPLSERLLSQNEMKSEEDTQC